MMDLFWFFVLFLCCLGAVWAVSEMETEAEAQARKEIRNIVKRQRRGMSRASQWGRY